jgi:hypothetical protein
MKITILCKCSNNFGTFTLLKNGSVTIPPCPKCSIPKPPQETSSAFADTENKWTDGDYAFVPHSTG